MSKNNKKKKRPNSKKKSKFKPNWLLLPLPNVNTVLLKLLMESVLNVLKIVKIVLIILSAIFVKLGFIECFLVRVILTVPKLFLLGICLKLKISGNKTLKFKDLLNHLKEMLWL